MAWEDLLKQHRAGENDLPAPRVAETQDPGSILGQVSAMLGQNGDTAFRPENADPPQEYVRLEDGYVRRSPVQPYQTAKDYRVRRIRRAVMIILGLCLAIFLAVALVRGGLLRLR